MLLEDGAPGSEAQFHARDVGGVRDHDLDPFAASRASATVLDVREPAEYVAGHVPGALLMPTGQLPNRMSELDPDQPVLVICASGKRSNAMTELLCAAGFDARSVTGGTTAWVDSGRPVEEGR